MARGKRMTWTVSNPGRCGTTLAWVMLRLATILLISLLVATCAADQDSPGFCSLSCDAPKMPSVDSEIVFLGFEDTNEITLHCQGNLDQPYPAEIALRFRVQQKKSKIKSILPSDGQTTETATDSEAIIPISGISFEPTVISGSTTSNNPDDSSAKYRGILTPQSEWCTDSCGVGAVDVLPECRTNLHDITVNVKAGPIAKSFVIKVDPN